MKLWPIFALLLVLILALRQFLPQRLSRGSLVLLLGAWLMGAGLVGYSQRLFPLNQPAEEKLSPSLCYSCPFPQASCETDTKTFGQNLPEENQNLGTVPLEFREQDFERRNRIIALARDSVDSREISRHAIESEDIDTGSVNSRTIKNYTIQGEDIDPDTVITLSDILSDHLTADTLIINEEATIPTLNISSLIDLGANTIADGNFTGDWDFNGGDLADIGTIDAGTYNGNTLTAGTGTLTLSTHTLALTGSAAINQDLLTTSSPIFAGLTLNGNLILGTNTLTTTNTALVSNLNADYLDGQHGAYYLPASNISGTANYISKFTGASSLGNSLIYDNGTNIGIGTTAPNEILDINGRIYLADSSAPTPTTNRMYAVSGDLYWNGTNLSDGETLPSGATGQTLYNNAGIWTATSNLYNDGTNIGIGTTTPGALLDVRDGSFQLTDSDVAHGMTNSYPTNVYGSLSIANATGGGLYIAGISDTDLTGLYAVGVIGSDDPTDTTPAMVLDGRKKNGITLQALASAETVLQLRNSGTNLITVLGNGNVGIGTTAPTTKLQIYQPTRNTDALVIHTAVTNADGVQGYGAISFQEYADKTGNYSQIRSWSNLSVSWGSDLSFHVTTAGSPTLTEVMRIGRSGNVGIGTTNPGTAKLFVSGDSGSTSGSIQVNRSDLAGALSSHILYGATGDWYIRSSLNTGKIIMQDTGGYVGIGTANPTARLHVDNGGIALSSSSTTHQYRIMDYSSQNYLGIGYWNVAGGTWYPSGSATNAAINIHYTGLVGIGTNAPASLLSVGGAGYANTGIYGYGADWGVAGVSAAGGVYGSGITGVWAQGTHTGVRGLGTTYDFYAQGAGIDYGTSSSIRWKRNIVPIDNALGKVLNLNGVYYDWDKEHGGQHDMGMIAEDAGKFVPEIVGWEPDGSGYATGMDYGHLTPVLVEAIKELASSANTQQGEISKQETLNSEQELLIKNLNDKTISVDDRISIISNTLTQQNDILNQISDDNISQQEIADDQAVQIKNLEEQMKTIQDQTKAVIDFALAFDLDKAVFKDAEGNVDLLDGKLEAEELATGILAIKMVDPEKKTIGTGILPAGEIQIEIQTKAIGENSKVFITAQAENAVIYPLTVTAKTVGVGFAVAIPEILEADLSFDWWIIESR